MVAVAAQRILAAAAVDYTNTSGWFATATTMTSFEVVAVVVVADVDTAVASYMVSSSCRGCSTNCLESGTGRV